jgi:hypothetical protein
MAKEIKKMMEEIKNIKNFYTYEDERVIIRIYMLPKSERQRKLIEFLIKNYKYYFNSGRFIIDIYEYKRNFYIHKIRSNSIGYIERLGYNENAEYYRFNDKRGSNFYFEIIEKDE